MGLFRRTERRDTPTAATRRHQRAATKIDRQVAAQEDANRRADTAAKRGRGWW